MNGIHVLDLVVIASYLGLVLVLGYRAAHRLKETQEDYFLAGRKLGPVYQFFLNFGNATDANGAVSTASLVYQQGVSGVWAGFQLLFLNPYYWFMNTWFRRMRMVTMGDLMEARLGSKRLAGFYAVFQIIATTFVVIGFGDLVTYKICSAIIAKPPERWSIEERASVENFQRMRSLEVLATRQPLTAPLSGELEQLHERNARGELKSYVTALNPLFLYLLNAAIVGAYAVIGGMAATVVVDVLQGILIVAFSILLIPAGLAAIGGITTLWEQVPAHAFALVAPDSSSLPFTFWTIFALIVVSLIQMNGIIGNMGLSGSARNEFSARFGAVSGTYVKRLLYILWTLVGLIAIALYPGENTLADPDLAWGTMSRQLLGPGLLGLMLVGVLSANMSTIAAQSIVIAALFVRNVYRPLFPGMSERQIVRVGRITIIAILVLGAFSALYMDDIFSVLLLVKTVSVPFGATVLLMVFWRRLTLAGVWFGLIVSIGFNVVGPVALSRIPSLRENHQLLVRVKDPRGRPEAVYFERVTLSNPADPSSTLEGSGRLHTELVAMKLIGWNVGKWSAANRLAARFFFDAVMPFLLIMGISLLTRPPPRAVLDQFYGRMKTPVGVTPELEFQALEQTRRDPARFDHTKLWPRSSWEFTQWNKQDTVGFIVCCGITAAILLLFWFVLHLIGPA